MPELWNQEWPNINTQRAYPLADNLEPVDDSFRIPTSFLVDMALAVNVDVDPPIDFTGFHIAQVGVFSSGITVALGYLGTVFATFSVPSEGFAEYTSYALFGTGTFFDAQGWVTIGRLDDLLRTPGAFSLSVAQGRISAAVIRPSVRTVTSISVQKAAGSIQGPFTGDIILQEGINTRLRVMLPDEEHTYSTIYIDAIETAGFEDECDCDDGLSERPCIKTINGVEPVAGNITLMGTSCVSISPAGAAEVLIADSCSEPCCDCNELEVVVSTANELSSQIAGLDASLGSLETTLLNISDNINASNMRMRYLP